MSGVARSRVRQPGADAPADPQPDRPSPHAPLVERHVLGAIILGGAEYLEAARGAGMGAEDLYSPGHQVIYRAMERLAARGAPIDTVTLRDSLARSGQLSACGGDEYLLRLTDVIPVLGHVAGYARIIADRATARRLQRSGLDIAAHGSEDYGTAAEYARYAEGRIRAAIDGVPVTAGADHGRAT